MSEAIADVLGDLSPSEDRAVAAVVGSAAGDALGAPFEFMVPGPGPGADIEMRGGGAFGWAPGEWTDDTAMALAVLDAIADSPATQGIDTTQVAANFLAWAQGDPPDIGIQTRTVMDASNGRPELLAEAAQRFQAQNPDAAGNGALMRTAPVALAGLGNRPRVAADAQAVAALTHPHADSVAACVLWSLAIEQQIHGEADWEDSLRAGLPYLDPQIRSRWDGLISEAVAGQPGDFVPNGWVVTAFQSALAAIVTTPEPHEQPEQHLADAIVAVISVGHDADTVAAIAGGLLGARWGTRAIPAEWFGLLHGLRNSSVPKVSGAELAELALGAARRSMG